MMKHTFGMSLFVYDSEGKFVRFCRYNDDNLNFETFVNNISIYDCAIQKMSIQNAKRITGYNENEHIDWGMRLRYFQRNRAKKTGISG